MKVNVFSAKFEGNIGSSTCTVTLTGPTCIALGVPKSTPVIGSMLSQPAFTPPILRLHSALPVPPVLVIVVE
ncbi:MAG: hypothetical protein QM820_39915 [Minicystis sp.]